MQYTKKSNNKIIGVTFGFTVIELIVVIVVIGILATITIVGYGTWQRSIGESEVKSDLTNVASAMQDSLNFNDKYPTNIPSTFNKAADITIIGSGSSDGKSYCFSATSSKSPSVSYMVTSLKPELRLGECVQVTAISNILGTPYYIDGEEAGPILVTPDGAGFTVAIGETLTAGSTTTPSGATIHYQWQSKLSSASEYVNITGANDIHYTPTENDINKNIRVVAIGVGDYYGDAPSSPASNTTNPWIDGVGTLPSTTKVYYRDLTGYNNLLMWSTTAPQNCIGSEQCDASGALVTSNAVDFSQYPARQACKAIGGRLPTYSELLAIFYSRDSYGYFYAPYGRPNFWSSEQIDNGYNGTFEAKMVNFIPNAGGDPSTANWKGKTNPANVRCVKG